MYMNSSKFMQVKWADMDKNLIHIVSVTPHLKLSRESSVITVVAQKEACELEFTAIGEDRSRE